MQPCSIHAFSPVVFCLIKAEAAGLVAQHAQQRMALSCSLPVDQQAGCIVLHLVCRGKDRAKQPHGTYKPKGSPHKGEAGQLRGSRVHCQAWHGMAQSGAMLALLDLTGKKASSYATLCGTRAATPPYCPPTYERGKGVHHQAGPHHNQQVRLQMCVAMLDISILVSLEVTAKPSRIAAVPSMIAGGSAQLPMPQRRPALVLPATCSN